MNRRTSLGVMAGTGLTLLAGCTTTLDRTDDGDDPEQDDGVHLPLGIELQAVVDRIVDDEHVVLLLETEDEIIGELVRSVDDLPSAAERDVYPVSGVELVLDTGPGATQNVAVHGRELEV